MKSLSAFVVITLISLSTTAWAQDPEPVETPVETAETPTDTTADTPADTPTDTPNTTPKPEAQSTADGLRYRWGIAASGGLEKVSIVSGPMAGMDLRTGAQINDLLGIYLQSHLSFGKLSTDGSSGGPAISGFTGTLALAAIAEATFLDMFFVGVGGGYGILNNPSGPMFQARVGAYPLSSRIKDSIRRRGLMVGADFRTVHIDGYTGVLVFASIGYEKF